MSFRLRASESVPVNVRRMARERLDDAVEALEAASRGDDLHENVHTARKRTKHVRALTRLARGAAPDLHDEVNRSVRDAARRVSDLRDRHAVLETLDGLGDEPITDLGPAIDAVRSPLEDNRDAAVDRASEDVETALAMLVEVRDGVPDWDLPDGVEALAGGFAKTYRRCRKRLSDARDAPSTGVLHEWRKRVKYHRYHVRVLEPSWPPVLGARKDELHRLSDLLGDDHDLAVLRGVLETDPQVDQAAARTLAAVLDRRRAELQRAALPLGERLFVLDGDAMTDQLRAWWAAWREASTLSPIPDPLDLAPAS